MNRFQLQQMLDGVKEQLKNENENLSNMYLDSKSTIEARTEQQRTVKDLEERFNGIKAKIEAYDEKEKENIKNNSLGHSEKDIKINAKAELIKSVMANKSVSTNIMNALGDGSSLGNGDKILPRTMTNELLYEPMATNPLREISTFTNVTNLEIPKIAFTLDNDDFIEDGATAKELAASTDTIVFDRNKFKVFCDITETLINGTSTNLVQTVEAGLEAGLAKKEKKIAFATTSPTEMSFYYKSGSDYVIRKVEGKNLYEAIMYALGDLEDDYSQNARIIMKKSDYFSIINFLANGNTALYAAQPEQVLGAPVIFCDLATIPVVGDFRYSHFNYDLNMLYDRDKNVKTGMESFVLTAWIDHKIKMKSAFRLAVVNTPSI
ncbi:phage major capsid protein [Romboutsia lituseburensis]|uniref:phage major capsid protein n=1 Tax=Romboutsia lituseburensis TaxID=1537 RepID=UPI00215A550D|nr:phage major capsid protein [Romboutsia lituseburensis]MCR8744343.1 phage major capsid protein [Romboutsia lituseburensis]